MGASSATARRRSSRYSVEPDWKAVCRRARNAKDLRPQQVQKNVKRKVHENRYCVLFGGENEEADHEESQAQDTSEEDQRKIKYHPLCSLDQWDNCIDQVAERYEGWERIPLKVDSGAVDTVIPKHAAGAVPLVETDRSKSGAGFRAANGTHIKHCGQKDING